MNSVAYHSAMRNPNARVKRGRESFSLSAIEVSISENDSRPLFTVGGHTPPLGRCAAVSSQTADRFFRANGSPARRRRWFGGRSCNPRRGRSEEHTSELQSHSDLVCRLLLEKKKQNKV